MVIIAFFGILRFIYFQNMESVLEKIFCKCWGSLIYACLLLFTDEKLKSMIEADQLNC